MRGTARQGVDYTLGGTVGRVTLGSGQRTATVSVHANTDRTREKSETAIMALATGTGYKLSTVAKATLTIQNK